MRVDGSLKRDGPDRDVIQLAELEPLVPLGVGADPLVVK